jgi:hypothetical protein
MTSTAGSVSQQRSGLREKPQGSAREDDDGGVAQRADQVSDGVGLAGARRAVQQQPALEVLTEVGEPGGALR